MAQSRAVRPGYRAGRFLMKYDHIDLSERMMRTTQLAFVSCLLLSSGSALGQTFDNEPAAVIELGGAASWSPRNGGASFGPAVAVEVTPIENWLEIEAGVTPFFGRGPTEWDTDLLLKKPWDLSPKAEFMLGVGPEWIHRRANGVVTDSLGAEVAADFMFWPSRGRHMFGWYLEPSYDYDFGPGHEQSVTIAAGLLIAVPYSGKPRATLASDGCQRSSKRTRS